MNLSKIKKILRKVLPVSIYDFLVFVAVSYAKVKAKARTFLLLHPVTILGRYPGYLYPRHLFIFLTTRCNLHCFICRREGFKGEDLNFENLYKLKNAVRHAAVIDLTGWGECFLYPRFDDVLRYIYSLNKRKRLIYITSNGSILSKSKAELLRGRLSGMTISLNAATSETYNRDMRHGRFEKTLENIRDFLSTLDGGDRERISLHFVAHTENFREIPDFVKLARELGIPKVTVGQYLVAIKEHIQYSLLNVKDEYNAIIDQAKKQGEKLGVEVGARRFYHEDPAKATVCTDPFNFCFVLTDGAVGPCCFCGSYRIGNVYEQDFEAVWFGKEYQKLRRSRHLPVCRSCSPYIPFDDPRTHLTASYKEGGES